MHVTFSSFPYYNYRKCIIFASDLDNEDMTQEELREIIAIDENYRIELTTSTGDMDKFQEAICAFANNMPGSRKKGYLLIGVKNN